MAIVGRRLKRWDCLRCLFGVILATQKLDEVLHTVPLSTASVDLFLLARALCNVMAPREFYLGISVSGSQPRRGLSRH